MKFEAILFDMDGVIVESETASMEYFTDRLSAAGYSPTKAQLEELIGRNAWDSAQHIKEMFQLPMSVEETLKMMDPPLFFQGIIEGSYPAPLIEGFLPLAQRFSGRLKCAIASGSPLDVILSHVKRHGLGHIFSAYVSTDEVPKGKPSPDVYLEAAKRLGVPIGRCIVIEDGVPGTVAGRRAGAHTVAVPTEYTRRFDFSAAHKICASLDDAREYIAALIE